MGKIVNVNKLNFRQSPRGKLQGYLSVGMEVEEIDTRGSWSQVQTTAWVRNDYLKGSEDTDMTNAEIIKRIVIHCSATKPNQNVTAEDINRWHTDPKSKGGRGWSRAGYHWVIERQPCQVIPLVQMNNDEVLEPWEISNGVRGYNKDSIHICYVGGLNAKGKPAGNISNQQTKELIALLNTLVANRPQISHIIGHNDLDPLKACPSFDVAKFLHKKMPANFAKKYALSTI